MPIIVVTMQQDNAIQSTVSVPEPTRNGCSPWPCISVIQSPIVLLADRIFKPFLITKPMMEVLTKEQRV